MVSRISGPIPPHPCYDKLDACSQTCIKVPATGVQHQTEQTTSLGQESLCLALEVEGHSMPSAYRHTKVVSKNHVKENMRRIRHIQKSAQQSDEEIKQPVKALWKLSKFDSVPSRIKEQLEQEPMAPRPQSVNYLRGHSRTGYVPQSARPASVQPSDNKLTVPKAATARDTCLIRRDIDFLKVNSQSAKKHILRRSPSVSALEELKKHNEQEQRNYKRGEMPKYLVERKKQWQREAEDQRARKAEAEVPAGHRLMADDERLETLEHVQLKRKALLDELSSMPIRNDTLRIRTKREELEQKLNKVEEAIKIFSRQKVFVKLDA